MGNAMIARLIAYVKAMLTPAAPAGADPEAGETIRPSAALPETSLVPETGKADSAVGGDALLPGIGQKVTSALTDAGYASRAALMRATDDELLAIKGIGRATLAKIRAALSPTAAE